MLVASTNRAAWFEINVAACCPVADANLTAPGLPEAVSFESRCHGGLLCHGIVAFLGFGWRDVADRLQQPTIVEPVHPLQRRELTASNDRQGPRRWMTSAL